MKFAAPFALSLTLALTLAGCDSAALSGVSSALGTTSSSSSARVSLSGTIFAPADQVAVIAAGGANVIAAGGANVIAAGGANVIAAGGANESGGSSAGSFSVLARSDESALAGATVKLSPLGGSGTSATAQTDTTGQFSVEVPAGTYVVTATFSTKSGDTITLTGLGFAGGSGSLTLDAAHHLVAAKLLQSGCKSVSQTKFDACVQAMESDLSGLSKVPEPTGQASAAASFDADADATCKAALQAALGS